MQLRTVAHLAVAAALACAACARSPVVVAAEDDPEVLPGLIDVELRGTDAAHRAALAALGAVVSDEAVSDDALEDALSPLRDELIELRVDAAVEPEALRTLRARSDVLWAEPVVRVHALWEPNDPDYKKQWHLPAAGAPRAWEMGRGAGVTVAILDTGIARVDDLDPARLLTGHNFLDGSDDAADDHGHGTHVAGTVAQSTGNGVGTAGMAPEATLLPLKVLSAFGGGDSAGISRAIRYAADHGAQVLNLSLGGGARSTAMAEAVAYARRKGCLVVCAAGNEGARHVSFPAAYAGATAVSAVGPRGMLAPYSSFGPEVALAAPGGDKSLGEEWGVLQETIDPQAGNASVYRFFQGTSMATPHVAGAAALLYGVGVTNPDAVERLLRDSARAAPAEAVEGLSAAAAQERYGAGLLDAGGALRTATLWWGLGRLALALLGAAFALAHARKLGHLRRHEALPGGFWPALVVGAGALTALAPLGLARVPVLSAFALPPPAMAARWLGFAGQSLGATAAAYAGWSALLPFGLALVARSSGGSRPLFGPLGGLSAGFAFGWAGLLLHAAVARCICLPFMPTAAVPVWLALGAIVSWWSGRALLAREAVR